METLVEKTQVANVPMQFPRYLPKEMRENLYRVITDIEPLEVDEFEGKIFMRGSCGDKPCKGYYQ